MRGFHSLHGPSRLLAPLLFKSNQRFLRMENVTILFLIKPRYDSRARGLSNRTDRHKMLSSGRGKRDTKLDKTNLARVPRVEIRHFRPIENSGNYSIESDSQFRGQLRFEPIEKCFQSQGRNGFCKHLLSHQRQKVPASH